VGLAPETLRRSNLGLLKPGSRVNIERALKADGRNSGHFVQGHVDCTGEIVEKWREGESLWVKVKVPQDIIPYIVPKGFVCVDGTSLTICDVDSRPETSWFTFMLVAHTQQSVIIPSKAVGELVNIEVDVLAKMVERSLSGMAGARADSSSSSQVTHSEMEDLKSRVKVLEELVQKLTTKQ
jgi:riboflavin synthase